MRRRFRRASDLTHQQRRRLTRALIVPLAARVLLPAAAVWWGFILLVLVLTRARRPDIDTNGWPFIAVVFPISRLVLAGAMTVGHILFVRWLVRYRTRRRGRLVAVRGILCPSDREPSRWRRLCLAVYGVTAEGRAEFLAWLDRPSAVTSPRPEP